MNDAVTTAPLKESWNHFSTGSGVTVALAGLLSLAAILQAQIAVGTSGSALDTFDSIPSIAKWSTRAIGATSAEYSGPNAASALDLAVQAYAATNINIAVSSSPGNPPGGNTNATWSATGHYLQTRIDGGIGATVLMATLTNISGFTVTGLDVHYDLAIPITPGPEDIPGHRAYYNLSGSVSNWVPIGTFATAGPQTLSLNLTGTPWNPGTAMYLLFVDDNAVVNPEGAYQIDNFVITNLLVPRLNVSRNSGTGELSISWTNGNTLLQTTNLVGAGTVWTNVPGNPNPYTFTPTGTARFFSLRP